MLLVFNGDSEERLDEVFAVRDAIYNDPLVDRTELVLAPSCIAVAEGRGEEYTISTQVRLQEDRTFGFAQAEFVEKVGMLPGCRLVQTPGRFDFAVNYCSGRAVDSIREILEDNSRIIDMSSTTIARLRG